MKRSRSARSSRSLLQELANRAEIAKATRTEPLVPASLTSRMNQFTQNSNLIWLPQALAESARREYVEHPETKSSDTLLIVITKNITKPALVEDNWPFRQTILKEARATRVSRIASNPREAPHDANNNKNTSKTTCIRVDMLSAKIKHERSMSMNAINRICLSSHTSSLRKREATLARQWRLLSSVAQLLTRLWSRPTRSCHLDKLM